MTKLLLGLVLILAGCDSLSEVASNTCGNLVVEAGEQCDGEATCNAACRYTCQRKVRECPGELACSVEGVCVASAERFVSFADAPRYEMASDEIIAGDLDGDERDDLIGVGESLRARFGAPSDPLLASYEKQIRPPTGPATIAQLDGRGGLDVVFPTAKGIFTLISRGRELDAVPYASTASLPDDSPRSCTPTPGWAACRTVDLDRDGRLDRVGFVNGRDNLEIELVRAGGIRVPVLLDTVDLITDVTTGDFDGDGFGDIAFAARSANGLSTETVQVVFGAPQADAFSVELLTVASSVRGVAAGDLSAPPDGIDDLAIERDVAGELGVAVYLGDSARDLSAPFALDGGRALLDVPYAVIAGEFVGGAGSGIDIMAYARNPADPSRAYLWWLRGLGEAQLTTGAVDPVDTSKLEFLEGAWQVGDLVMDLSVGANGPDEVIGLSPRAATCTGPAVTVAVPSARFTATELLRTACLDVPETGWQPSIIGLLAGDRPRAVALARRGAGWWLGEASRLDDATSTRRLSGRGFDLADGCRGPQIWNETPNASTQISWVCYDGVETTITVARRVNDDVSLRTVGTVPRGSEHLAGDFNGDGLTDLVIRNGREIAVMLQCAVDMAGSTPGC